MAQRGSRARAAVLRRQREPDPAPWWVWALMALCLLLAGTVRAQTSAPVLPPGTAAATIPPGAGGSGAAPAPQPRSEDPLSRGTGGARPVPDAGILAAPSAPGSVTALRPDPGAVKAPAPGSGTAQTGPAK